MITVSQLWKYPFKSGRGQLLASTGFDNEGMIDDRRLLALDKNGRFLTARQHSQLLHLSCTSNEKGWLLEHDAVSQSCQVANADLIENIEGILWKDSVNALDAGDGAARWLSEAIGIEARVGVWRPQSRYSNKYQLDTSFADASPILLASEASVVRACEWAGLEPDVRRFRPNIVVNEIDAFEEDNWREIEISGLKFEVLDPCVRCILTTIDPDTAVRHEEREPMVSLMKNHATEEGQPLFGINLRLVGPAGEKAISVGDEVRVNN